MNMSKTNHDKQSFITRIHDAIKGTRSGIKEGDIGVYCDELGLYTKNNDHDSSKHTYNAKIKVIGVYESLVEIILVDEIRISDSTSLEISQLIQKNFPRFVHPKNVRWQIK
jgi:hypothetical protein